MPASDLTAFQRNLLSALPAYVKGAANVRAARALESRGLATVTDNGSLGRDGSNTDGERWWVDITDAGNKARDEFEIGKAAHNLTDAQWRALRGVAHDPARPHFLSWTEEYRKLSNGRVMSSYAHCDAIDRSLRALERMGLVRDGRTIEEDGATVSGERWALTDDGIAVLATAPRR